ncbi:ACT domain-containing protein [Actinomadura roseirufa]|uniref:ACT domain-containing protein n=1 Tax=Actinomadura roseirufa TaxID=2094049 RepID=UPI001041A690|nr:ACT domain-containing protein [Actinomadura roseirufa]
MAGETDLGKLLGGMRPRLNPGEYVFTTIEGSATPDGVRPVVTVVEDEGLTLVLRRDEADRAGIGYEFVAGWITLNVHSALEAIGLTAAVADALTRIGLSCNVVAGFYHDHIFVPHARAAEAVIALKRLAADAER